MKRILVTIFLLLGNFMLAGCSSSSSPPAHPGNVCLVFHQYPKWYWAVRDVAKKWHVPISLQMAFIFQESHFRYDAAPVGGLLSEYIPWFRPTSAEGYAQAIDDTWHRYVRSEKKISADRDNFADAVDFIGWYVNQVNYRLGIKKNDSYRNYLAYHEGIQGYHHHSYRRKGWLRRVAKKVQARAYRYHLQLSRCVQSLPKKPWWYL